MPDLHHVLDHSGCRGGPRDDRRDWAALLTIGFGVSLVIMDATIVNVALPVVIDDLSLSATEAQWMNAVHGVGVGMRTPRWAPPSPASLRG